ncbi:hypothetical protein ABZS61_10780 [Streptomyces sp. NPDC005566]|uniref:hypothetical protein n=1 Tax=Streptomyces sp. NPDC005566 TaxID=3156886 RepID=UPI0033BA35E4
MRPRGSRTRRCVPDAIQSPLEAPGSRLHAPFGGTLPGAWSAPARDEDLTAAELRRSRGGHALRRGVARRVSSSLKDRRRPQELFPRGSATAAGAEAGATAAGGEPPPAAETPKILTVHAVRESDVCVTMGCGDTCPVFPGKRHLDRKLDDPAGQVVAAVRTVRDSLRVLVEGLIEEIGPAGTSRGSSSG